MLSNRACPRSDGDAASSCPTTAERGVYAPPASGRIVGLAGTTVIFAAVVAGFFLTIRHFVPDQPVPPALVVVDLLRPASPPEDHAAPKPVKRKETPRHPPAIEPVDPPPPVIAPDPVPVPITPQKAEPTPRGDETAAPKTLPAPSAPHAASNAADTWEGRVLAALNTVRRYPRVAMARRQQGVPYVRFVMDRAGTVLSSRLERSCGFADLDREAVALVKRASPLPKPPDTKPGDTLELVVPVEFFLSKR